MLPPAAPMGYEDSPALMTAEPEQALPTGPGEDGADADPAQMAAMIGMLLGRQARMAHAQIDAGIAQVAAQMGEVIAREALSAMTLDPEGVPAGALGEPVDDGALPA